MHCRHEIDTVQYVINKYGYRETTQSSDGNVFWYGLALRDHDIDLIKMRKALINRYPLMDVSASQLTYLLLSTALCQEKHLLRHYQSLAKVFPKRLSLYARLLFAARRNP